MNHNSLINKFENPKLLSVVYTAYSELRQEGNIKISNDIIRIDISKLLEVIPTEYIITINDNLDKIIPELPMAFKIIEGDNNNYEFYNLPECFNRPIPDIRSKDINTFVQVSGKILAKGKLNPRTKTVSYICQSCQKKAKLIPDSFSFETPKDNIKCICGGKMIIDELNMEDMLYLQLEENAEDVKLDDPKTLIIALKGHHTELKNLEKLKMGVKVNLTGKIEMRKLEKYKEGDFVLILNSITYLHENNKITLTDEDKIKIKELKDDPELIRKLSNMIDEDILGYHDIKESLLYYLAGSIETSKMLPMINVLLVGEPGTAKSQMSKAIEEIATKVKYASGKNSSAAGLTAGVVKDEALGGYTIKMGAIPLYNNGHVIADELDKLTDEDKSSLLEAMSMGTVSVNKIVSGKFSAKTSILGIANPKKIKFNNKESIYEQLGFTQDLFSRFEFIWIIKNEVDEVKDSAIASILINTMFESEEETIKENKKQLFLKKYIKYVRDNFKPKLDINNPSSVEASKILNQFYVNGRLTDGNLTARMVNAAVKVACAHAKLRQSNVIEEIDAKRANMILTKSLRGLI